MKIYKTDYSYYLTASADVTIRFSSFVTDNIGVELYSMNGHHVATLNFEAATEFYKAWRAAQ